MFEPYVAESVPSLQEPKEPLQSQETLTKEDMEGQQSLHALFRKCVFLQGTLAPHAPWSQPGDPKPSRPRALFGAEALLAATTPEIIRAQAWQSLRLILLNVEDSFVRQWHTFTSSHHSHTMAQSIWPRIEIARTVFSLLANAFLYFFSFFFQGQLNRMNFVSCRKSVCLRIDVGTLHGYPWLMTEGKDIPILCMAMAYTTRNTSLFAEHGTTNMSAAHRCMPHCSNHWLFAGFLPSRTSQADPFAFNKIEGKRSSLSHLLARFVPWQTSMRAASVRQGWKHLITCTGGVTTIYVRYSEMPSSEPNTGRKCRVELNYWTCLPDNEEVPDARVSFEVSYKQPFQSPFCIFLYTLYCYIFTQDLMQSSLAKAVQLHIHSASAGGVRTESN